MGVKLDLSNKSKLFLSITVCCLIVLATYTQRDMFSMTSHSGSQSSQIMFLTKTNGSRAEKGRMIVMRNESMKPLFGGKVLKDVYQQGFENPLPNLCSENKTNVVLLIMIASAPNNTYFRMGIRMTWGLIRRRGDVAVAFMLGVQDDPVTAQLVAEENRYYKDMIIERNVDSYRNLTLKTMAMFEWVRTFCRNATYILKTDDDVYINAPRVLEFVNSLPKSRGRIYGKIATKWLPIRDKKSKHYLSETEFSGQVLPDFTTGPAYMMTSHVASALYEAASSLPLVTLEDVFFTGVAAQKVGVTLVSVPRFMNDKLTPHKAPCVIQKAFAFHDVNILDQFTIWTFLADDTLQC